VVPGQPRKKELRAAENALLRGVDETSSPAISEMKLKTSRSADKPTIEWREESIQYSHRDRKKSQTNKQPMDAFIRTGEPLNR
jgi:hypothetical protein